MSFLRKCGMQPVRNSWSICLCRNNRQTACISHFFQFFSKNTLSFLFISGRMITILLSYSFLVAIFIKPLFKIIPVIKLALFINLRVGVLISYWKQRLRHVIPNECEASLFNWNYKRSLILAQNIAIQCSRWQLRTLDSQVIDINHIWEPYFSGFVHRFFPIIWVDIGKKTPSKYFLKIFLVRNPALYFFTNFEFHYDSR